MGIIYHMGGGSQALWQKKQQKKAFETQMPLIVLTKLIKQQLR